MFDLHVVVVVFIFFFGSHWFVGLIGSTTSNPTRAAYLAVASESSSMSFLHSHGLEPETMLKRYQAAYHLDQPLLVVVVVVIDVLIMCKYINIGYSYKINILVIELSTWYEVLLV